MPRSGHAPACHACHYPSSSLSRQPRPTFASAGISHAIASPGLPARFANPSQARLSNDVQNASVIPTRFSAWFAKTGQVRRRCSSPLRSQPAWAGAYPSFVRY